MRRNGQGSLVGNGPSVLSHVLTARLSLQETGRALPDRETIVVSRTLRFVVLFFEPCTPLLPLTCLLSFLQRILSRPVALSPNPYAKPNPYPNPNPLDPFLTRSDLVGYFLFFPYLPPPLLLRHLSFVPRWSPPPPSTCHPFSSLPDAHVASSLAAALELAKNLKEEKERGRKERAAGGGGLGVPMVTWIGGDGGREGGWEGGREGGEVRVVTVVLVSYRLTISLPPDAR